MCLYFPTNSPARCGPLYYRYTDLSVIGILDGLPPRAIPRLLIARCYLVNSSAARISHTHDHYGVIRCHITISFSSLFHFHRTPVGRTCTDQSTSRCESPYSRIYLPPYSFPRLRLVQHVASPKSRLTSAIRAVDIPDIQTYPVQRCVSFAPFTGSSSCN